jgi:hypothetical protein
MAGDEQHARLAAEIDRQLHRHAGKYHDVVEGNEFEGSHVSEITLNG